MIYPKNYSDIKTGRASIDSYIKKHYPDFYEYLKNTYVDAYNIKEQLYMFYHNIANRPVCKHCGRPVKFYGNNYGFSEYCSYSCSMCHGETREKIITACKDKYGENFYDYINDKASNTKLLKYGDSNYNNFNKYKDTCIKKYGVDNVMKSKAVLEKVQQTCLQKYGASSFLSSDQYNAKRKDFINKSKQTSFIKYGCENPMQSDSVKNKVNKTCLEKYGVEWNCLRNECHNSRNTKSKYNEAFAKILTAHNISYEREFILNKYAYDFKINNILVEINPAATHNINWNPFDKEKTLSKTYHLNKSLNARDNGYRCIHVWEWDDINKIVDLLTNKTSVYARKCVIKEIKQSECNEFLCKYHLQGTCKGQKICLGLFYNNELIQVMSFGKPRYNKNYEWELLRLCTKTNICVIGGAEKLFHYFIKSTQPASCVSYCDFAKFTGNIYDKLGFTKCHSCQPSCHWYNIKTQQHITNNLLLSKGYDNLFNTNYGKNVSNAQLMLEHDWVQVFDAGQITYVYKNIV